MFNYRITADVTDINGETQSGEESVSVGYVSLLIGMDVPSKVDPSADSSFKLTATNLDGRSTPSDVRVKIELLNQPDRVFIETDVETAGYQPHDQGGVPCSFPL